MQRRSHAVSARTDIEKSIESQASQTDESGETDVRIELGTRDVDVTQCCFDTPTLRDEIRATAEQIGRQGLRQRSRARGRQRRRE